MSTTKIVTKLMSDELTSLIKKAVESLTSLHNLTINVQDIWEQIKVKGQAEGYTEKELRNQIIPLLPQNWTKHDRYFLFNRERRLADKRANYQSRTVTTNEDKEELDIRTIKVSEANTEVMDVRKQGFLLCDFYIKGVK